MKTSFWSRILDTISPRRCVVCGRRLSISEHSICSVCYLHLPRTDYQQSPYDNPMAQLFWGLAPVSQAASMTFYESHSDLARLVYALKYAHRPDIGEDLGRCMGEEMKLTGFFDSVDYLIPVPLARNRQRQRGYNQSEMLCRGISATAGVPVLQHAIRRNQFSRSQTTLTRAQRQENVSDMFALHQTDGLAGKHLLLVDDICTTGATLSACANTLNLIPDVRISVLTLGFTKS